MLLLVNAIAVLNEFGFYPHNNRQLEHRNNILTTGSQVSRIRPNVQVREPYRHKLAKRFGGAVAVGGVLWAGEVVGRAACGVGVLPPPPPPLLLEEVVAVAAE